MLYDKGIGHDVEAARELKQCYGDKVQFNLLGFLDVKTAFSVSKAEMQVWGDEGIINYLGFSGTIEAETNKVDCMVYFICCEGVPKS